MIEVRELSDAEILVVLRRLDYGHLGCCRDGRPYVVPVHFAFDGKHIYVYTTEGKKFDIITENPQVCLQLEEVTDDRHWLSVIVDGYAEQIGPGSERDNALAMILKANPTLTPAVSIHWMDNWVKENVEVVYRITPETTSGREAAGGGQKPIAPSDRVKL